MGCFFSKKSKRKSPEKEERAPTTTSAETASTGNAVPLGNNSEEAPKQYSWDKREKVSSTGTHPQPGFSAGRSHLAKDAGNSPLRSPTFLFLSLFTAKTARCECVNLNETLCVTCYSCKKIKDSSSKLKAE